MTDIVERLREWDHEAHGCECHEAADEIERLREEVKELTEAREEFYAGYRMQTDIQSKACIVRAEKAEAEVAKLREALSDIVRRYEFRSELYIDDATCAGSLYDTARIALAPKEKK